MFDEQQDREQTEQTAPSTEELTENAADTDAPADFQTESTEQPEQNTPAAEETASEMSDPFAEAAKTEENARKTDAAPLPDLPDPFSAYNESSEDIPKEKKQSRKGGIVMLVLIFLAIVGFSVFCIYLDIQKGSVSGGYRAGDVTNVTLMQAKKPVSDTAEREENGRYTVAGVAEAVMPSVVEIYTYLDGAVYSSGSGIILTEDGYIATNAHVVAKADSYEVTVSNKRKYSGKLIGHDSKTDIAVLKIEADGLKAAVLGDSDETKLGEDVCALGNPAGLSASISSGIVSGLHRQIQVEQTTFVMDCIQTDAAISPGNSGGALVNRYGQVIGITSSKYGSSYALTGDYEGLGFAISINEALPILTELMEQGYVGGRVRFGIQFYAAEDAIARNVPVPDELRGKGLLVLAIDEDSDLKSTTFKVGDFILEIEGKEVKDYNTVMAAVEGKKGGDRIHAHCATVGEDNKVTYYEIDFSLLTDTSGDY